MPPPTPLVKRLLVAWVALWVLGFLVSLGDASLARGLGLDPLALYSGDLGETLLALPGLITYVLVHGDRDLAHIFFNCWLFWIFAPEVERIYAGRGFLRLLLKAALVGTGVTLVLAALLPGTFGATVIGGSGLVAAAMATHAALFPGRRMNLILFQCRLISLFVVLMALDLLWFLADLTGSSRGVAHHVHLAGAAVGWLHADGFARMGLRMPWQRWAARRRQRREERARQDQAREEAELDRILGKISREGLNALTDAERAFLERRSQDRR